MKKTMTRHDKIRAFLRRARVAKTIAEIRDAIGETADETKYIASSLLRMHEAGELKRRATKEGFVYKVA